MSKCGHNIYWQGNYGTCMACRAEEAETKLKEACERDLKNIDIAAQLQAENARMRDVLIFWQEEADSQLQDLSCQYDDEEGHVDDCQHCFIKYGKKITDEALAQEKKGG